MFIFPSVMSVCPSGTSTLDDDVDADAATTSWCMLEVVSLSLAAAAAAAKEDDIVSLGSICDEVLNCEEMIAL